MFLYLMPYLLLLYLYVSEKVVASLNCHETSNDDAKIVTWLHRYIRNLSKTSLNTFVQFIKGSGNLLPDNSIKVEFVNEPLDHVRKTSKEYFKILYVPRQYSSLNEIKQNFNFYILKNLQNWCAHDQNGFIFRRIIFIVTRIIQSIYCLAFIMFSMN